MYWCNNGTSNIVGAKTGVVTCINEIELHAHFRQCHGQALETIKAVKIMRDTFHAAFELNTLPILSKKERSFQ